jgi:uncharacterized protein (DUF1501 family)
MHMFELNRRKFLTACAGIGAGGLLGGVATVSIPDLMRVAADRPLPVGTGILVLVTLYGGNDGINTVIPYCDNAYHDARPELAYGPDEVIDLDGHLGLNPGLTGMVDLFHAGHLAIVRGVGYPRPDQSHFRSMDIWQTASPDEPVSTGWVGRWLDATGDDPLRAVNVGSVLPLLAVGEKATAAALSPGTAFLCTSADTISGLGVADSHDTPAMAMVRASYRAAKTVSDGLPAWQRGNNCNSLADQLDAVAQCVSAGVPTRVYCVQLGGFDTHADERETQQRLLQTLDDALTGFLGRMSADPHGRNVVVLAYSEFGRRVKANASQGTDHGTAGPVFVAGTSVKGGLYGDEPSLTDLDDGDLKTTVDFRDIYFEILTRTLRADPTPVLGSGRREVGFLSA